MQFVVMNIFTSYFCLCFRARGNHARVVDCGCGAVFKLFFRDLIPSLSKAKGILRRQKTASLFSYVIEVAYLPDRLSNTVAGLNSLHYSRVLLWHGCWQHIGSRTSKCLRANTRHCVAEHWGLFVPQTSP